MNKWVVSGLIFFGGAGLGALVSRAYYKKQFDEELSKKITELYGKYEEKLEEAKKAYNIFKPSEDSVEEQIKKALDIAIDSIYGPTNIRFDNNSPNDDDFRKKGGRRGSRSRCFPGRVRYLT